MSPPLPDWARFGRARAFALGDAPACGPAAVTVGNFDGLHLGHRAILERVLAAAAERGLESALLTFEPSPGEFFRGADAAPRCHALLDLSLELERSFPALDHLVVLPFDARLAATPAEDFADAALRDGLQARFLAVGGDFRFGQDRAGDVDLLRARAGAWGCAFETAPTARLDGERVSSTRAREALAAGDFALAERLLGRPYAICARVVEGDRRGRELGFPTANLDFPHNPALRGVFAVAARLRGDGESASPWMPGAANIGTRPTVDGLQLRLEVHLLDFDGDLYGQHLEVRFRQRLREERKFASVDELRTQIAHDIMAAHRLLTGKASQ